MLTGHVKQLARPVGENSPGWQAAVNKIYYSTITLFYHIRTRERAKYESVLHCIKRIALKHLGLKLFIE